MFDKFTPKFCKRYVDVGSMVRNAITEYVHEVEDQAFPGQQHSYTITDQEFNDFIEEETKLGRGDQMPEQTRMLLKLSRSYAAPAVVSRPAQHQQQPAVASKAEKPPSDEFEELISLYAAPKQATKN